jgi:uncharacterized protein (TIGR02246 family)
MSTITEKSIDVAAVQQAYSAAWAAHDPDAIAALHTEDTHFETHIGTPSVEGRDALRANCAQIFEMYEDFRSVHNRVLYGDKHWVLDWTMHATIGGKDISVDCLDVVVLSDDGLVALKDAYMDAAQLQAALA